MSHLENFKRFWVHQLTTYDCDTSIYVLKYIIRRMELNIEQKYWICWLYANTYQIATTWVIFNEFPDYQNVNIERLEKWNKENKHRLPYQKDQKWLRGNIAEMFVSYKQTVGDNQDTFFTMHSGYFNMLWETILKDFHRFGRYTGWMYLQVLEEICGLDLNPRGLQLNHSSSWAHRAGLCLALDKPEWAEDKKRKFSTEELTWLEQRGQEIQAEVERDHSHRLNVIKPNFYSMETALCAFYKLFRKTKGRYLGYYLDRMAQDIINTSSHNWNGINWDLLWESRSEILIPELMDNSGILNKEKMCLYMETGDFYFKNDLLKTLDKKYFEEKQK